MGGAWKGVTGIHRDALQFWDPVSSSSFSFCPSFPLSYLRTVLLAAVWDCEIIVPGSFFLCQFFHDTETCFSPELFLSWEVAAVISPLMIMPWGIPPTCWVLHVKLTVLLGEVSLGSLQLPVAGKSSPCLEGRVRINGESDGRQGFGCSSHVPNAVPFRDWPEQGHYLGVFWHIWVLSIILCP